jgi:hypothetical protein
LLPHAPCFVVKLKRVCNKSHGRYGHGDADCGLGRRLGSICACITTCVLAAAVELFVAKHASLPGSRHCTSKRSGSEGVLIPAANIHGLMSVRKAAASCDAILTLRLPLPTRPPRDMFSEVRPRPWPLPRHCAGPLLQQPSHAYRQHVTLVGCSMRCGSNDNSSIHAPTWACIPGDTRRAVADPNKHVLHLPSCTSRLRAATPTGKMKDRLARLTGSNYIAMDMSDKTTHAVTCRIPLPRRSLRTSSIIHPGTVRSHTLWLPHLQGTVLGRTNHFRSNTCRTMAFPAHVDVHPSAITLRASLPRTIIPRSR